MTTLKDISVHTGVSLTQVSRALNDHADVSQETKEKVWEAARALQYQKNLSARRLATGRSGTMGLVHIVDEQTSDGSFIHELILGLSQEFEKLDQQFILNVVKNQDDAIRNYQKLIRSSAIDGFVVFSVRAGDRRIGFLLEEDIPFVLHGRTTTDDTYAFFDIDNDAVGYDLTRHLLDHGHERIAFLNGPAGYAFAQQRLDGYRRAHEERGLAVDDALHVNLEMTAPSGLAHGAQYLASERRPSAFIASNMLLATGIYQAVENAGLQMPKDVSLVAHDDGLTYRDQFNVPADIARTVAPLSDSWVYLTRFLVDAVQGKPVDQLQKVSPHEFKAGSTVAET